MELELVEVLQGNSNGCAIERSAGSDVVLRTTDLVGCIAVLISGVEKQYLIHSDSNNASGKGYIAFVTGVARLVTSRNENYKVGLYGGESVESLQKKFADLKKVLPHADLEKMVLGSDSAYLTQNGIMVANKKELAKQLKIDLDELHFVTSEQGSSFGMG